MLSKSLFSLSALLCLAAAVPLQQHQHHHHQKREVVWTTKVVEEFVTIVATTTVHLQPGQSPPAGGQPQPPAGQPPSGQAPPGTGHEEHHRPKITSTIHKTVTVQRAHPTAQTTQAPPPSNPTTPPAEPSPVQQTTQTTTQQAAPSPVQQTTQQPAPSPTTAAQPTPSSGGGGSSAPSGQTHTGDITYYAPGLGSCGITNGPSDMIVALAEDMMLPEDGANPNDNPLCGRSITISYGGKTAVATIEDTCPGCAGASLDLTPSLFEIFAPLTTGRVSGVEWWFN